MNTYIVRRALIIGLALVSVAWAQQAPDEAARLRRVAEQYLKQYPEADANADGELTREEFTRHAARLQKQQAIASLGDSVKVVQDVEYASVEGNPLKLDLYLPIG